MNNDDSEPESEGEPENGEAKAGGEGWESMDED